MLVQIQMDLTKCHNQMTIGPWCVQSVCPVACFPRSLDSRNTYIREFCSNFQNAKGLQTLLYQCPLHGIGGFPFSPLVEGIELSLEAIVEANGAGPALA